MHETSPQKPETLNPNNLSPLGQSAYHDFIDATKEAADPFFKDLNSTETGVGILSKAVVMRKERMEGVQALTARHFHRLVDQVAATYERRLFELDGIYKKRLEALTTDPTSPEKKALERVRLAQEYQRQFTELSEECGNRVNNLRENITDLAQQFGGANEFLDTAEEIDRWARYGLPLLKNLKLDDASLAAAGMEVQFAKNQYSQAFKLLRKLRKGEEFNLGEYEQIFTMMGPYMDRNFEREDKSATRETLSMLEHSGALVLVEAMNPEQRFKLGEAWIAHPDRNPMQKRQGILFLASANYLSLRQADDLLRRIDKTNPAQYALREEEWKAVEATQALVKKVREEAAETMARNPQRNITGQYFTASNAMFYEVIGRIALIGIALSTGLAVQRATKTGDPSQLTQTLISPIYVAGVATVGVTYEHLTGMGHIGKGGVSKRLARLQTKETETPEARTARLKDERLRDAMGRNVETLAFLRAKDGEILGEILKIAEEREKPEEYQFSFADLGEDKEYHGLDYRTLAGTENEIAHIFQLLYVDLGLQTVPDMLRKLEETDRKVGIS